MLPEPKASAVKSAARDLLAVIDTPEAAALALRTMADAFNESAGELAAAWQDSQAGKVWARVANRLDTAAAVADRG